MSILSTSIDELGNQPSNKLDIKALSSTDLLAFLATLGQPAYRTRQIEHWLYAPGVAVRSFEEMTNLPQALRKQLSEKCTLDFPRIVQRQISHDGSRKYALRLADESQVECVGIPSRRDDEQAPGRLTVCFSTQVGCAMGCVFCATGQRGLVRSLTPGEMVDQLTVVAQDFAEDAAQGSADSPVRNAQDFVRVSNAVAMGQGEPFANYDATLAALRFINNQRLFGIGARHIVVSTSGILSSIRRFSDEPEQFTLAISLHSALQNTRDKLLSHLSKQPLVKLRSTLANYLKKTGRRPTLEFALIKDLNDSDAELEALISFCKGTGIYEADTRHPAFLHVNLIPFNTVDHLTWRPSPPARIKEFERQLKAAGIEASIRSSRGSDIAGACGQLAGTVT